MKFFGGKKTEVKIRNPHFDDESDGYAFRRSRTLTGSSSADIRAAGESRAQIKSPRLKEHELKRHRNLLSVGLLATLLVAFGIWWLTSEFIAGKPEIRSRTALTASTMDTTKYQDLIDDYFGSRPLERFQFALNENGLLGYVQQRAPEVRQLSVESGSLFGKGVATLEFREPLVGWQIRDKTYLIDGDGVTFQTNHFGSPSVTVHDASGVNPSDGIIASNRFLSFLGRVISGVNKSGVGTVSKVTIPAGTTREIDLSLTGKPYRIKLQMDREPSGQVADVVAIVQYLSQRGIIPEYVDVRVPSKAFYR